MPSIASMTVPPRAHPVLRWLAGLDDAVAAGLVEAVSSGDDFRSSKELISRVEGVPGVSPSEAQALVYVLFNLLSLHFTHGWLVDDMAATAASAPQVEIPAEDANAFEQRLAALLSARPVVGLAKAFDVAYEYDHIFHTARILSDLRPIFGDDPNDGALGVVLSHTLRLDYFDRGNLKTYSVVMSDSEIEELQTALDRAKSKAASINSLLSTAGLTGFEFSRG